MPFSTAWGPACVHADDPRERLRRYLEQRRDLGESELVLDTMEVGEVLRLLGASGPARSAPPAPPRQPAMPAPPKEVLLPPVVGGDWRAALRASGAAPELPPAAKTPRRAFPAPPAGDEIAPVGDAPRGIVVGSRTAALLPSTIAGLRDLAAVAAVTMSCTRCPLHATAHNAVPGEGNSNADLMIVGEAPGATEDETGRPFVGESGQLLTRIIEAINLRREDVFIANVIKHRPPANRNPKPDEVAACSPYLLQQIALVKPKVLLALGTFAAQTLLETKIAIGKLRGQVHEYHGVPLIVTYHPAALLRNPAWKRPTWEDVQLARRVLDRASGA